MATADSTAAPIVLEFPGPAMRTYAIAPEATLGDVENMLSARIAQLDGLLSMTYGEGGEVLRGLNDSLQDNFMWACSSLATEVLALSAAVSQMRGRGKSDSV